jgi:NAD(P)-dependent dehydrogenase (short-subunit alcohol dehydrogenase family)
MKIGIMGAGNMGAAFARRLAAADHEVAIAAHGLDEARKVASEVGHRVRAVPPRPSRWMAARSEPLGMLNIWSGYVGSRGTNIAPRWTPPRQLSL